jgi:hypothetical protein
MRLHLLAAKAGRPSISEIGYVMMLDMKSVAQANWLRPGVPR